MILITGGTGFIGNVLIRHLSNAGYPIKLLLRPSKDTPNLPKGLPVDVSVTSLDDENGMRAVLKGIDIVFHLASAENYGRKAQLAQIDVAGTRALVNAAINSDIKRFFFLSHLGADTRSAYPLLKAKALAENIIKKSGLPYTIFRSAIAFGEHDHFTNGLGFLLKISPFFVMLPDNGSTILQPIWVEDLVTVLTLSIDLPFTRYQTYSVGGPEFLSFRHICNLLMEKIKVNRQMIDVPPVLLYTITELLEIFIPNFPTSVFWLDYFATDRTTNLDVLPSTFNLLPARMSQRLEYLQTKNFRKNWWRIISKRKRTKIQWD